MSELELIELGEVSEETKGQLNKAFLEYAQGVCKTKPIEPDDECQ